MTTQIFAIEMDRDEMHAFYSKLRKLDKEQPSGMSEEISLFIKGKYLNGILFRDDSIPMDEAYRRAEMALFGDLEEYTSASADIENGRSVLFMNQAAYAAFPAVQEAA